MAPQLARVALVFGPDNPSAAGYRKVLESAAPSFGIKMIPAAVRSAAEIESAVERFAHEPNGG